MVSFKNGVLKVQHNEENTARTIYEICFFINAITLFAFYEVKMIGTITGIMMLLASMLLWIGRRQKKVVIPYNTVWYAVFTVYAALSCLWSSYMDSDIVGHFLRMVVIMAMITSISIYVDTPEDLERIIKIYMASMLVIVMLEFLTVPVSEWADGKMGSHFGGSNPNDIAFIVWCAELMAFYEFYSKGKKKYLLLVVLFIFFIILTSSRKAMFVALAGPMMFVVLSTYKKHYILNVISITLLAVLIAYFIMTNENAYNAIGRRITSMVEFWFENRDHTVDNSLYLRSYYIDLAQRMFAESPLFGKGMGNFAKILDNVYMLDEVYSHNNFWQILSELGLVGFLIYYSMYFVTIIKLAKNAFIKKSRVSLLFFTFIVLLLVLETGFVTYNSKMPHIVIAFAYMATYVGDMDGRQYAYIENNRINSDEE